MMMMKKICNYCLVEDGVNQCSACKLVNYCSLNCQKKDWKSHKTQCGQAANNNNNNNNNADNSGNSGNKTIGADAKIDGSQSSGSAKIEDLIDGLEKLENRKLKNKSKLKGNDKDDRSKVRKCLNCFNEISGTLTCGKCLTARYCNVDCQHQHWPIHKQKCKDSNHEMSLAKLAAKAHNYSQQMQYQKAEKTYRKVLSKVNKMADENNDFDSDLNRYTFSLMNEIGLNCLHQGKLAEGEEVFKICIEKQKKLLGEDDITLLNTCTNLASLYEKQGKLNQAQALLEHCISKKRSILGDAEDDLFDEINNLSNVYDAQGRYQEAEELLIGLMNRRKNSKAVDVSQGQHQRNMTSLRSNLAGIYASQGRYSEAEAQYNLNMEQMKSLLGENHIDYLNNMGNLAGIFNSQGKYRDAERLHRECLRRKTIVLGEDNLSTLSTMAYLGTVLTNQSKLVEAAEVHKSCLEKRLKLLPSDHFDVIESMHNYAGTLSDQGHLDLAEEYYKKCLAVQKDGPFKLVTMNTLGLTYDRQGKYKECEKLLKDCYEGKRRIFGPDHPSTLNTMLNIATNYDNQNKFVESEKMFKLTLAKMKEVHGIEHMETLNTMHNLGNLYLKQIRFDEAEALFKPCLELREKELGVFHPYTRNSFKTLIQMYSAQLKYSKAEQLCKRQIEGLKKATGETSHPSMVEPLRLLGEICFLTGNLDEAENVNMQMSKIMLR